MLVVSGCNGTRNLPPPKPEIVYQQVPVLIAIPDKYLKECLGDYLLDGKSRVVLISDLMKQSVIRSDRLKKCSQQHSDFIAFYLDALSKFQANPTVTSPGIILSNIQ